MNQGIEIGATFTKAEIVDDMVQEAQRLGVSPACVRRIRDGIVILHRGNLEEIRIGKGSSAYARTEALARVVELVGDAAA